jgi:hypothetical protein
LTLLAPSGEAGGLISLSLSLSLRASEGGPGGSAALQDARSKDVHNLIDELLEQTT